MRRIFATAALSIVGALLTFQACHGGRPGTAAAPVEVIAHRGLHVNWQKGAYDRRSGCEAQHILTPKYPVLENTPESIEAAFRYGSTMVEIDIRRTKDDQLVVFHDYALDCRTNGTGLLRNHTLAQLRTLDIGYRYSADGGRTFPFRGKGIGKMPTLEEILTRFPERRFLIDHKDGTTETAALLATVLGALPPEFQRQLFYWGPRQAFSRVQQDAPGVSRLLLDRAEIKKCLMPHLLTLGVAPFDESCRGEGVGFPAAYARWMWGWPHRFLAKAQRAQMRVYVLADTPEDARALKGLPITGVITDNIDVIGPYFTGTSDARH